MNQQFDTIIVITPNDFKRLSKNYINLVYRMPSNKLIFVGSNEVKELVDNLNLGERVGFINENEILSFDDVHKCMSERLKDILKGQELPRKSCGWYYQQFIKMQYAFFSENEYYMSWDGDTIPCKKFSMFKEDSNQPFIDVKNEYHEEYFNTMATLIPGMRKCIEKSFISEHMLFNVNIMKQLISKIMDNNSIPGNTFYEKIFNAIPIEKLQSNSFSEFETYGTFVCFTNPSLYRIRDWHSFRLGGEFFDPDKINSSDYLWLSKDFFAISFEKGHFVREDHKNLFDNPEYQHALSPRQMLEIAQEEFQDGYLEIWDNDNTDNTENNCVNESPNSDYEELKNSLLNDVEFLGNLSDELLKVCSLWGPAERVHLSAETCLCNTLFNTLSGEIFIDDYTFCGHNVSILTGTHNPSKINEERMDFPIEGNDIHIGTGVWIGSNATILGPCTINDNAVVAAGSVVLPNTIIGDGELWAGVPAVFKKNVTKK